MKLRRCHSYNIDWAMIGLSMSCLLLGASSVRTNNALLDDEDIANGKTN